MALDNARVATLRAVDHIFWPQSYPGKVANATVQVFALIGLSIGVSLAFDRLLQRAKLNLSQGVVLGGTAYGIKFSDKVCGGFIKHRAKHLIKKTGDKGRVELIEHIDDELDEASASCASTSADESAACSKDTASDKEASASASDATPEDHKGLRMLRSALDPSSVSGRIAFVSAEILFLIGTAIGINHLAARVPSGFGQRVVVITGAHLAGILESLARSITRHRLKKAFRSTSDEAHDALKQRIEELEQRLDESQTTQSD